MIKSAAVIALAAALTFTVFPAACHGTGPLATSHPAATSGDNTAGITDGEMHRYGMNRFSPNDGGRTDTDGYGVNNYRAYASNERGAGWGWLGLLGLFGLAGLFGPRGGRGRT